MTSVVLVQTQVGGITVPAVEVCASTTFNTPNCLLCWTPLFPGRTGCVCQDVKFMGFSGWTITSFSYGSVSVSDAQ